MLRSLKAAQTAGRQLQFTRSATRKVAMANEVHLSGRRAMKKIKMGKARPAIFYQFDTLVELSDGSVIKRRSQAPKDEIRMITDQRNNVLWNPNRSELSVADPFATGKVSQFNKRFSQFQDPENEEKTDEDLFAMLGENASEVQLGGKLLDKKASKGKK